MDGQFNKQPLFFSLRLRLLISSLDAEFKMASSKIVFSIVAVMAASCAVVDGALSWGSFLGADWMTGEGEWGGMRMSQLTFLTRIIIPGL